MFSTRKCGIFAVVALALSWEALSQPAQAQFFGGGGGGFGGGGSFGGSFGGGSSFGGSFGGGSFSGGSFSGGSFSGGSSFSGFSGGGSSFRGGMGNGGFRESTPVYREPVYVQPQPQPQPVVVTPPPAPKVEPNEVKPLPLEPLENAVDAINVGLSAANRSKAIRDLTDARGNLDADLEAGLGEALKDESVATSFDRYVDATSKSNLDELDRCRRALESAHMRWMNSNQTLTNLARKQRQRKFQSDLDQQEGTVRALSALTRPNPQEQKLQAGSMATILYWPNLPNGEMAFVSADVVFCGVGRSGLLEVRCVNAEDLGGMLGLALVPGKPVAPTKGGKASGVVLDNPAASKGTVNFNVDGHNITLEPGYMQRLPAGKTYRVTFDRGAGQGTASYALDTGTYQFWSEKNGWDLWKMTFTAVIDNSANRQDFHLMFNGQQMTVKARKTLELKSPYAVLVKFHPGSGDTPAVRELDKGVFRVGVTDKGLDLFAANDDPVVRPDSTATASLDPPKIETPAAVPTVQQPPKTETVAALTPPKTETRTDAKTAPNGKAQNNPATLAAASPAQDKLRSEMAEVAKAVKQFLDGRGETSIALGKFPSTAALNGAAPDAQKTLGEELAKLDVGVKELGALSIDGQFSDARDRKTQRLGVHLSWQIRDRQEEVLIEAERSIFGEGFLPTPASEQKGN